jgi:hypothetical protein
LPPPTAPGCTSPKGKKELVGLIDGARKCAPSWKELSLDLKGD